MSGVVAILGAVFLLGLTLRIGTAMLSVTGLARDVARFQVRSAFFGVGYTTAEAETVVNHPVRRRIVQTLMLLGSVGITGVIGSAAVTLARNEGSVLVPIATLAVGLALLWALATWRPLDRGLTRLLERLLRRWTDLETHDYHSLLRISADYAVQQVTVAVDGRLDGRTVDDAQHAVGGLVLLGVERIDGSYVGAPRPETVLHGGDTLTVYGHNDVLSGLAAER